MATATAKEALRCNDKGNGNVWGDPAPPWGMKRFMGQKRWQEQQQTMPNAVTSKGATRGGGRGTRRSCDEMGVEALGNTTTN